MFELENYFNDFIDNDKIFKNRNVLRPDFIPDELPHRDLEIQKMAEIVACSLKDSRPNNIFIYGKPGTGKTAVVKHVSKKLNAVCQARNIAHTEWIFLNCNEVNTSYRVLAKICDNLDPDHTVPIAGWPIDILYEEAIKRLEEKIHGTCFLVLDEIDLLVEKKRKSKNSTNILYYLSRINSKLTKTQVSIIGISNVLTFKDTLDPRVISSLGQDELIFPSYDALELKDILNQRVSIAFNDDVVEEGVLALCGALAAKEHGDARKALDLIRKAGELAERRNSNSIDAKYVYLAQDSIEDDKMQEYCERLPLQQKTVLYSIYQMERYQYDNIVTGEIYNCYEEIQDHIPGLNKLSQRRVSELIRELDLAGIINAQLRSSGRGGRTKHVKLNIPVDKAYKYLSSDENLNGFLDFKLKYIRNQTKQRKITRFNSNPKNLFSKKSVSTNTQMTIQKENTQIKMNDAEVNDLLNFSII